MFRPSRRRALLTGLLLLAILLATGCASHAPQDFTNPVGDVADKENTLFQVVFWIAVAVFVLVEGLLIFVIIRFRRRGRENAVPAQVHGNTRLEVAWTIAPALVLAVIAVPTVATIFDINADPSGNVLEVTVTGHQWWWEFNYAQSGVVTANELHIPMGRPVHLSLESADVIHSFWIPKLAGKQDVVPGRTNTLTIQSDTAGVFMGQCVEFCGLSHANMRIVAVAQPEGEFQQWLSQEQLPGVTPAGGDALDGQKIFLSSACLGCHTIGGTIAAGKVGPNLTHFASRLRFAGSMFDNTPENVAAWLRDPPGRKPGSKMPNLNLTQDQITKLVAFLEALK